MIKATTRREAQLIDNGDALAPHRERFHLPEGVIYLDGNSLGPMAKAVPGAMGAALEQQWATDLISSWNKAGWWDLPISLGDKIAPLVGADAGQIVVTDSTSINIYKTVQAALALDGDTSDPPR